MQNKNNKMTFLSLMQKYNLSIRLQQICEAVQVVESHSFVLSLDLLKVLSEQQLYLTGSFSAFEA